jgi:xanthine/CO dehydrogenase XdhC/CoxF family maturation factor
MKELQTIAETYRYLTAEGVHMAMATVVRVRGSAYRRPGARMLIAETGRFAGSVSGGCLEEFTMADARDVMRTGKPKLISFDTRLNSRNAIGMGYGCNGLLDVLIEPVHEGSAVMHWLESRLDDQAVAGMATVFACSDGELVKTGARLYRQDNHVESTDISDGDLQRKMLGSLEATMADGVNNTDAIDWKGAKVEVLNEVFQPAVQLLIYGAVFHTMPVKQIAEGLGWNVAVRDDPSTNANLMDFPGAEDLVVDDGTVERTMLHRPSRLAVLFLTHNFMHIIEKLKEILPLHPVYIGILGSRKKTEKILQTLQKEGFSLTDRHRAILHYPVGLDIGGDKPESIALSVAAEIHAAMFGRKGGKLRDRPAVIHPRPTKI